MAQNGSGLPGRGSTFFTGPNRTAPTTYGTSVGIEGTRSIFKDVTPSTTPGVKTQRSNREVECELVRNVSGITLLPKRLVVYAAGYIGRRIDGYGRLDQGRVAGVLDEYLTNGCPNNDMCWIVKRGPTLVLTDLAGGALNVVTEGDYLVSLTAATSQATTAGRVQSAAATSSVTGARDMALNRFGIAMSAKTTANTNADLLVDVILG